MKSLKDKTHDTININKRKTKKANKNKRVWMFRKGNLVVCYKIPFVNVQKEVIQTTVGGALDIDKETILSLFKQIKSKDSSMTSYIDDNNEKLADYLLKSAGQPSIKPIFEILKNGSDSEKSSVLLDWVKKRKIAEEIISDLKKKIKTMEPGIYSDKDLEKLEKTLNDEDLCNSPGKLTEIASSVFDKMKMSATSLGEFIAPNSPGINKKYNENVVQLLWFPRSSRNYKRGNSRAADRKDFKMGDFMIYVQPEKYADTMAYVSDMLGSVEDYFTDVLQGCNGPFCLTGDVKRKPIKHQVIRTIDNEPQIELDEYNKNLPLQIRK
jgi:hypothetical protein